jgi:hypothetical protein
MHETAELNVQHNKGEQENNTPSQSCILQERALTHQNIEEGLIGKRKNFVFCLLKFPGVCSSAVSLYLRRVYLDHLSWRKANKEKMRVPPEEIWRNTGRC